MQQTSSFSALGVHADHELQEIDPCVYCVPCNVRLYQGRLPEGHPNRPTACAPEDHDMDYESSQGFYGHCRKCGALDWYEDSTPAENRGMGRCDHQYEDKRCCHLPLGHEGDHVQP